MRNLNPPLVYLQLFLNSLIAFVLYGIVNTQITMRLSPDYFAIFYSDIFDASNPTISAIVWGVRAMWWVGALIGLAQVLIVRFLSANELHSSWLKTYEINVVPLIRMTVFFCVIGGLIGYGLAATHLISVSYWFPDVSLEMEARFLAVVVWHGMLYISAALGGLILCMSVFGMSNRGRRWL